MYSGSVTFGLQSFSMSMNVSEYQERKKKTEVYRAIKHTIKPMLTHRTDDRNAPSPQTKVLNLTYNK